MKTIKKPYVFIPLLAALLFAAAGITVKIAGQSDEIKIRTGGELVRFLEKGAREVSGKAVLYADITLAKTITQPELACEFDGNGHSITVKDTGSPSLFGTVTETGAVRNLVLAGNIGSAESVVTAGIALQNSGTVENCVIKAEFSGGGFVSGICHTNNGKVINCFVQSDGTDDKEPGYIWNPVCAESYGSVKQCFYADGKAETVGAYIKGEEMKTENLPGAMNEYAESDPRLAGWKTDKNGSPTLKTDNRSQPVSVFSGGPGIILVCVIILITALTVFTVVYADRQKKVCSKERKGE